MKSLYFDKVELHDTALIWWSNRRSNEKPQFGDNFSSEEIKQVIEKQFSPYRVKIKSY